MQKKTQLTTFVYQYFIVFEFALNMTVIYCDDHSYNLVSLATSIVHELKTGTDEDL